MKPRLKSVVFVVITLALGSLMAGCTAKTDGDGKGDDATVAPPATYNDETGAIEGVVIDESDLPIADAELGLRAKGQDDFVATARSDDEGKFTFSELAPGTYKILVQRLGFVDADKDVEVVAGQVTDAGQIRLAAAESLDPFSLVRIERGLFGCGASWFYPRPPPPVPYITGIAACGVLGDVSDLTGINTTQYDRFLIEWYYEGLPVEAWDASVFEMQWTSNQVLGRGLTMVWETPACFNAGEDCTFARQSGASPLRVYTNQTKMQDTLDAASACEDSTCLLWSRVFADAETAGSSSPVDVGVALQQPYEAALSAYFHGPAPTEWTAFA